MTLTTATEVALPLAGQPQLFEAAAADQKYATIADAAPAARRSLLSILAAFFRAIGAFIKNLFTKAPKQEIQVLKTTPSDVQEQEEVAPSNEKPEETNSVDATQTSIANPENSEEALTATSENSEEALAAPTSQKSPLQRVIDFGAKAFQSAINSQAAQTVSVAFEKGKVYFNRQEEEPLDTPAFA